ncbi:aminotransferase class I/II-fold pyridoxal phosphate-dependent enzyme [Kribbella flavida]|uniref:aminotransferase class I/II-fold pyridoxal phosphate-dependent enzyme n=1 Tax=Kribbella flavida TaxID=182640 RepID=UPI00019BE30A|nr:aminotransferase class I/II-fold pyridoxal phosphate-dependent enzyme [Kribbella flavida]
MISLGSLSKVLWGGLRIGWLRAAKPVIARLARLRAVDDLGGNVPTQLAASVLVAQLDELRRHRSADLKSRHDLLVAELARALPEWEVTPVSGGQTLWIRLPYGDGTSYAQAALREGVAVLAGEGLDAGGGSREYLRVHFQAEPSDLVEAVRRMAAAWQTYRPPTRRITGSPALTI